MLLNGDKAEQRMQLETIIEAYEEFSEFDTAEIGLIEPLRAMRLVYYLARLMRRWADPAFPKKFPVVNRGRLLAATDGDFYRTGKSSTRTPFAINTYVLIGESRS